MLAVGLFASPTPVITAATWHAPIAVTASFIRDVQITGDKVTGNVYIAGMDERVAAFAIELTKSIVPPTAVTPGPTPTQVPHLLAPARSACRFLRHDVCRPRLLATQGWGQPAAYNGVVSLVYAARNTGNGDPGDVFYIRSTDSGVTFARRSS